MCGGWAADEQADSHDGPLDQVAVLSQDSPPAGSGLTACPHQGPAPYRLPRKQCGLVKRDSLQGEKAGFEIPSLLFVAACSDDFTTPASVSSTVKQS